MKKILFVLLGLSTMLFQSCLKDQDDVFDKSASERVAEEVSKVKQALINSEYGWVLEYYPEISQSYGGYVYTLKFDEQQVEVNAEDVVKDYSGVEGPVTSYYSVNQNSGALLTFDTYNELLHFFSTPTSSEYQGYGGTFEFVVDSLGEDVIKVHATKGEDLESLGNITHSVMYLYRLTEPAEDYLAKVKAMQETMVFTIASEGIYGIDAAFDYDSRQVAFASSDTSSVSSAFTFTDKGIRLYNTVSIEEKPLHNFVLDETELTLTSTEEASNDVVFQGILTPDYVISALGATENKLTFSNDAVTKEYNLKFGSMFTYTTDADWVSISQDGETLTLSLTENTTGTVRAADVVITSAAGSETLRIVQYDMENLYGLYYLCDGSTGSAVLPWTFQKGTENDYEFVCEYDGYHLTIPVVVDSETNGMYIESGAYWGMYGTRYYVYPIYGFAGSYWTSYATGIPYSIMIDCDDSGTVSGTFSGTYYGYELETLYVEAFKSQSFSSAALAGYLDKISSPILVKQ